ncbi:hypothetical protein GEMRC1_003050 [Eukaryota sp. GEM-RC1]
MSIQHILKVGEKRRALAHKEIDFASLLASEYDQHVFVDACIAHGAWHALFAEITSDSIALQYEMCRVLRIPRVRRALLTSLGEEKLATVFAEASSIIRRALISALRGMGTASHRHVEAIWASLSKSRTGAPAHLPFRSSPDDRFRQLLS